MTNTDKIRELNDLLRTQNLGGVINITSGVRNQGDATTIEALRNVKNYNDFSPDNDPYNEHDFGSFTLEGSKYFWKIDYYDLTYTCLSDDPANPKLTNRVLTVMLASEY